MNGRLSTRVGRLQPSATLAVSDKAAALRVQGVDVLSFGAGEPDFPTPQHVIDAGIAALRAGDTKYPTPVAGIRGLRDAICRYLSQHAGLRYTAEQVCVGVGAKDILYRAFVALLDPGDEALIPVPFWVSYPDQVALADGTPVLVRPHEAGRMKITADELESALTPASRVLILNSPSNPSGAVYSRAELEALCEVVRGRDLFVVSDEIYHRLVFDGQAACASVASIDGMYERTLTVNGVSKTYAMTGWRLGFAAGPPAVIAAMNRLQGQMTSGPASFVQTAAIAALEGDQQPVQEMRKAYLRRRDLMVERLNALPGVRCEPPLGAFYCFPDVSRACETLGLADGTALAETLLERAHVAVVPGAPFGSPNHVRFSFATSDERIAAGMDRVASALV